MNKASQMAGMIAEADRYSRIVEEFPPQDRILSRILERQTNRYRERVLLKCGDVQWTYNETFAIAGQWAQRLSEAGVAGGDRVAIICGNRPEFLQIYLGCAWLGAVAVPINSAFRGAQLAHVLSNSLPKLLVVEAVHRPILKSLPEGTALPSLVWNIEDDGVHDASGQMPVYYRGGPVPDIFGEEVQVVVEGKVGPDGTFQASTLLAKCPSKFEAQGATGA